ncbi:hypothetical protein ALC57_13941 [Trachymyrmex cornetzi]|uniref:Uncharacterized protein n=1 Tax=Trachymyrmex cornetzi TaxID=471704 RepID=A0A195DM11_9HYME|nr:hypothetical protein ALC57_13941 [Trachymyrmex cornetzi]
MYEPQPVRRVARFTSGVPFKLSDSSYSPRAIIVYYSRVLRECSVRGDATSERRRRSSRRDIGHRWSNLAVNIIFFTRIKLTFFCLFLNHFFDNDLKMIIFKSMLNKMI